MRRLLAPIVLAAALVGAAAPSASADSCYGPIEAYVCFGGDGPTTGETPVGTCLYTGGSQCTPYYVGVPWANLGSPTDVRVCSNGRCRSGDEVAYYAERLGCLVYPSGC